jgi:hypothetical protein
LADPVYAKFHHNPRLQGSIVVFVFHGMIDEKQTVQRVNSSWRNYECRNWWKLWNICQD